MLFFVKKIPLKRDYIYISLIFILLAGSFYFLKTNKPKHTENSQQQITAYDADQEIYQWEITTIATGLEVPWDLELDDDKILKLTPKLVK